MRSVATHVNRGILRLRRGLVDEAVADFDRAIALDPEQPEAYLNKGAALIRRQNPAEALQLFTVALERNTTPAGDRPLRARGRQRGARQRRAPPIATIGGRASSIPTGPSRAPS